MIRSTVVSPFLTVDEMADYARISSSTVRWWIQTKALPSVKVGRHRLIRRTDAEKFLETPLPGDP